MSAKESVQQWLEAWGVDPLQAKAAFTEYFTWFCAQEGVELDFKERPGISYSLRAKHAKQEHRPLFVLVDVVDDDPEERWLSVCFYADMVEDPKGLGDFVPQGLMGQDALCLNLEEADADMQAYIQGRLEDALRNSRKF